MDTGLTGYILAIITINKDLVGGGGCPIFYAEDEEQQRYIALLLSRILGGIVHDLENGVYFIARH
ncbi:hypothetical protein SYNTR_1245 [Candidatus Syntrophocurvum alkaliphilum]|uniref:Uncharacterized protein n=1 Tax=Candidatus Syntrophocurvum alkaliphilum TaxID=2293317 RepID=A0A6I6DAL5_9FIRM|nr:hypothetical protein [Candidatus Syntrophocurvum alkaliphilum]QGT99838.1 hypothetical protein SYNTR_1245 [Candidatus Syntrophocurvum alkaliphilum]